MQKDLCDLTVVMDRSGSMGSCQSDMEGGLNSFIEEQKRQDGRCNFTLVQFDTEYEFVHKGVDIQSVGKCTLQPRGATALLDAVGKAVSETGIRLEAMPESERPGLVVFLIITDGLENSSREYTRDQIKEMITRQSEQYSWQFSYLGANQDAFAEGGSLGVAPAAVANVSTDCAQEVFTSGGIQVSNMRHAVARGVPASFGYTDDQRKSMKSESSSSTKP